MVFDIALGALAGAAATAVLQRLLVGRLSSQRHGRYDALHVCIPSKCAIHVTLSTCAGIIGDARPAVRLHDRSRLSAAALRTKYLRFDLPMSFFNIYNCFLLNPSPFPGCQRR